VTRDAGKAGIARTLMPSGIIERAFAAISGLGFLRGVPGCCTVALRQQVAAPIHKE